MHTTSHLILSGDQLWVLVIGALVPLATYVLNHYAPWISEPVKGIVHVVVAAVAAALYTAVSTHVFGFNQRTLELVLTGVVAALGAHRLLWNPAGISAIFGGGRNAARRD